MNDRPAFQEARESPAHPPAYRRRLPGLQERQPPYRRPAERKETRPPHRPKTARDLETDLSRLRAATPRTVKQLQKLGVSTVGDLLRFYPRRHENYSRTVPISRLVPDRECTVIAEVLNSMTVQQGNRQRRDTKATLADRTGTVDAIWFGQTSVIRMLEPGATVALSGKPAVFRGRLSFQSPIVHLAGSQAANLHTGRMTPIYPLTEGLKQESVQRLTWEAVNEWLDSVEETLPRRILQGRMPLRKALREAHYPPTPESWEAARTRLAFEELLILQLAMQFLRQDGRQQTPGRTVPPWPPALKSFVQSLPFTLTKAQRRCIREINLDMAQGAPPMNRLLQGEVGTGKTVVALAALLTAVAAGGQGALMAPTEVLAEQHFRTVCELLGAKTKNGQQERLTLLPARGLDRPLIAGLFTGSLKARERRRMTEMAAEGTLDIAVGTHALIQEGISLPNLALAVTDEQHRFGVLQRSALRHRGGENAHSLMMSATPIPRTLSLTLYGDLNISTIDEQPSGRRPVRTKTLDPSQRQKAYRFILSEAEKGHQSFIVCPRIEASPATEVRAAKEMYEKLREEMLPELRTGLLHGRMRPQEKESVLRSFREGDLDTLVSTTVVEVGIDMPNATVMLVEGADRFGLAQLHQLRGRVGRGNIPSYCLLLPTDPGEVTGATAKERLAALENSNDGFHLAEVDLQLRGPGDFFGTRQSGMPTLRMARLSDMGLLREARDAAAGIIARDPSLKSPELAGLAAQAARFTAEAGHEAS